jgi:hypothetical protein
MKIRATKISPSFPFFTKEQKEGNKSLNPSAFKSQIDVISESQSCILESFECARLSFLPVIEVGIHDRKSYKEIMQLSCI